MNGYKETIVIIIIGKYAMYNQSNFQHFHAFKIDCTCILDSAPLENISIICSITIASEDLSEMCFCLCFFNRNVRPRDLSVNCVMTKRHCSPLIA